MILREPEPERTLKNFYDISKICIEDLVVEDSTFIAKFVSINYKDIFQLSLKRVKFRTSMQHLIDLINEKRPFLKIIEMEDVDIGDPRGFQRLIYSYDLCHHLKAISFRKMNSYMPKMDFVEGIKLLKRNLTIRKLDISGNNFSNEEHAEIEHFMRSAKYIRHFVMKDVKMSVDNFKQYISALAATKAIYKFEYSEDGIPE